MNGTQQHGEHRLIIRRDLRVVQIVQLGSEPLRIGRSARCDITLSHEAVSRHHADIEKRDDGWYVVDAGSVNGVLVNGEKVDEVRLVPGDVIEIRPFAMNYLTGEPGETDRSVRLSETDLRPTLTRTPAQAGQIIKQRLEDLYALSRLVLRRSDNGTFWQKIHRTLQRTLPADRCVVVAVDDQAGIYRLAPQARPSDSHAPLELSRTVLGQVIESGKGLLIQHVAKDDRFAEAQSLSLSGVDSVICAPVVVDGRTRAVVYADRRFAHPPFQTEDLDFVMAAVDLAATAVGMDDLHTRTQELSRIRGRIETAREMQEVLLPSPIPQPTWGQVAARNYPAEQMSGDIYDVLIDKAGRLVVSVADVSGKGVPAAFVTAILQDALRQSTSYLDDLGEIVQRINAALSTYASTGCFATMVICRWSASGDAVEIANAGHHAPLWVDASGKVEATPEGVGLILGFEPEWRGRIVRREASSDVAVLLSTDGATEARSPAGDEYGLARLGARLSESHDADAETPSWPVCSPMSDASVRPRNPRTTSPFSSSGAILSRLPLRNRAMDARQPAWHHDRSQTSTDPLISVFRYGLMPRRSVMEKRVGPLPGWSVVVSVMIVLLFCAPGRDAAAQMPPEDESLRAELKTCEFKIVYESRRDGSWELIMVNADGSEPSQLTRTPKLDELYPQVSPDGTKVCFVCDEGEDKSKIRNVYVMDIDGTGRTLVCKNARQPCWKRDGTAIAYLRGEFEEFCYQDFATKGIFIYDVKTGEHRRHVNHGIHHLYNPSWSPDGKWLTSTVHAGMGYKHAILAIEANGMKVIDLKISGCRPDISADGTKLTWGASDWYLTVADLDTSGPEPKLDRMRAVVKSAEPTKVYHSDWSPDGKYVAFSRGPAKKRLGFAPEMVGIPAEGWNICVADAKRINRWVAITTDGQCNKEPDWAPVPKGK